MRKILWLLSVCVHHILNRSTLSILCDRSKKCLSTSFIYFILFCFMFISSLFCQENTTNGLSKMIFNDLQKDFICNHLEGSMYHTMQMCNYVFFPVVWLNMVHKCSTTKRLTPDYFYIFGGFFFFAFVQKWFCWLYFRLLCLAISKIRIFCFGRPINLGIMKRKRKVNVTRMRWKWKAETLTKWRKRKTHSAKDGCAYTHEMRNDIIISTTNFKTISAIIQDFLLLMILQMT